MVLRKIVDTDANALFGSYSVPDIASYFVAAQLTNTAQATHFIRAFRKDFQHGEAITWALSLRATPGLIGTRSGVIEAAACAEVGYDLARAHWGKGLMTEVMRAIPAYSFRELRLRTIEADTLSVNACSIRLLRRLGFQLGAPAAMGSTGGTEGSGAIPWL